MTCHTCIHRMDVTLWGLWMATGCSVGLVICANCQQHVTDADVIEVPMLLTCNRLID